MLYRNCPMFRVYSGLRILFFVNVKSPQTFFSQFWYQSIALVELYPTLSSASRKSVSVTRRIVLKVAGGHDHTRRHAFFYRSPPHSSCQVSRHSSSFRFPNCFHRPPTSILLIYFLSHSLLTGPLNMDIFTQLT